MIYFSDELSHYGVRGMKWGIRKQMPSSVRMTRSRKQMTPEERSALRKKRAKQAAVIGGTVAVAALAAYGHHKYSSLKKEMNQMNGGIKLGKSMVDNLYKENKAFNDKHNPLLKSSISYLGNDFKYHTATKTANSFENLSVDKQKTFDTVRDYARAKKRYTGHY